MNPMKPTELTILGKRYTVVYCDRPSDVDASGAELLWGQLDSWARTIRVYSNDQSPEDRIETLIHEMIEHIAAVLHLDIGKEEQHDDLDSLAMALTDTLLRNDLLAKGTQ